MTIENYMPLILSNLNTIKIKNEKEKNIDKFIEEYNQLK